MLWFAAILASDGNAATVSVFVLNQRVLVQQRVCCRVSRAASEIDRLAGYTRKGSHVALHNGMATTINFHDASREAINRLIWSLKPSRESVERRYGVQEYVRKIIARCFAPEQVRTAGIWRQRVPTLHLLWCYGLYLAAWGHYQQDTV